MTQFLSLRDGWPLYAGMLVAGAAAIVASAATLSGLAHAAGWSSWTPWLLPAALDVGGSVGGWCWLRPGAPERARAFGRIVAISGALLTLLGNAAGHLVTTGYLHPSATLIVIVGAVPAIVLVALAHLAALLTVPAAQSQPSSLEQTPTKVAAASRSKADTRDAVLQLLQQEPMTVSQLAAATGRSRSTVVGHLTVLSDAGTVHRDPQKRYRTTPLPPAHLITSPEPRHQLESEAGS